MFKAGLDITEYINTVGSRAAGTVRHGDPLFASIPANQSVLQLVSQPVSLPGSQMTSAPTSQPARQADRQIARQRQSEEYPPSVC